MSTSQSADDKFELELCWCIQQLQNALSTQTNVKQKQDINRSLNVLKSKKAPLIKKRQVMRTTFGDYRAKMLEEEKKFRKANSKVEITVGVPSKKSQFLRKKSSSSTSESLDKKESGQSDTPCVQTFKFEPSNNSFRFNFDPQEM